jgi:hypothetical protein
MFWEFIILLFRKIFSFDKKYEIFVQWIYFDKQLLMSI